MPPGIVTKHAPKPIGDGWLDWEATFEGEEPFEPIGLGLTEGDAVADLIKQMEDEDVAE